MYGLYANYQVFHVPTISTFMSGKTELLKIDTLLHICEGFEITLGNFFSEPMFDTVEQEK